MSLIEKDISISKFKNETSFYEDFLPIIDAENPLEIKKMWEKARNFLVKEQEISS